MNQTNSEHAFPGSNFLHAAGNIYNRIFAGPQKLSDDQLLLKEINQARRDWLQAESIFNETTDKTLIDHAIYDMMAAKTRYSYLVQRAREQGVNSSSLTILD